MTSIECKKRRINVIVDNPSWITPFAKKIISFVNANGDIGTFVEKHEFISQADISFYLGCVHITPFAVRNKSKRNLVVHASDLPLGRGFSPLTWQILEGKNQIPVSLFEMIDEVDAGPIVYKDKIDLNGHELLPEIHEILGKKSIELCVKYLNSFELPESTMQSGNASYYKRRYPSDSKIDTNRTIDDVFNLFRVADNNLYPVFFEKNGFKYILKIEKCKNET